MNIEVNDELLAVYQLKFPNATPKEIVHSILNTQKNTTVDEICDKYIRQGVGAIVINRVGNELINLIKKYREITGSSLRDAKIKMNTVKAGTPYILKRSEVGDIYSMYEAANILRQTDAQILFNMDPCDIVRVRNECGLFAPEVLKRLIGNV